MQPLHALLPKPSQQLVGSRQADVTRLSCFGNPQAMVDDATDQMDSTVLDQPSILATFLLDLFSGCSWSAPQLELRIRMNNLLRDHNYLESRKPRKVAPKADPQSKHVVLQEISLDSFSRWNVSHYWFGCHITYLSPGELKRTTFRKVICFYDHSASSFAQAVPTTD